jgi:hypothetical protein
VIQTVNENSLVGWIICILENIYSFQDQCDVQVGSERWSILNRSESLNLESNIGADTAFRGGNTPEQYSYLLIVEHYPKMGK